MAIAFDASSTGQNASTSLSFSHTCSGSDRLLVVCVGFQYTSVPTSRTVTYNSVSMTEQETDDPGLIFNSIFTLVAPATGSNTVAVSSNGSGIQISAVAMSFTGVDQGSPIGNTTNGDDGTRDTSQSYSLTTANANSYSIECQTVQSGVPSVPTNVTQDFGQTGFALNDSLTCMAGAYKSQPTAQANTLGFSWTGNAQPAWTVIEIKAAAVASAIKTINGLAKASVKTVDGLAIASVKSWNGLE